MKLSASGILTAFIIAIPPAICAALYFCDLQAYMQRAMLTLLGLVIIFEAAANLIRLYPSRKRLISSTAVAVILVYVIAALLETMLFVSNSQMFSCENLLYFFNLSNIIGGFSMAAVQIIAGTAAIAAVTAAAIIALARYPETLKKRTPAAAATVAVLGIAALALIPTPLRDLGVTVMQAGRLEKLGKLDPDIYRREFGIKIQPDGTPAIDASSARNLVFIILESTENTFLDQSKFPGLLPNLKKYYDEGVTFDNISMAPNAELTFGAMFAAMTGSIMTFDYLPSKLNSGFNYNVGSGLWSFPKMLSLAGYHQIFLFGCPSGFAGTGAFVLREGFDVCWSGSDALRENGEKQFSVHDSAVYEEAWRNFEKLADAKRPFNITLLTFDAHGPQGIYDPREPAYPNNPDDNFANGMFAGDAAMGKFIERIKQHPAGENTTIVFINDHNAHRYNPATPLLKTNPARRLTCIMLNSGREARHDMTEGRTFDIAPTILDAMALKHDYRFPLGESLFGPVDPRRLDYSAEQNNALRRYISWKTPGNADIYKTGMSVCVNPIPAIVAGEESWPLFLDEAEAIMPQGSDCYAFAISGGRREDMSRKFNCFRDFMAEDFGGSYKRGRPFAVFGRLSDENAAGLGVARGDGERYFIAMVFGNRVFCKSGDAATLEFSPEELLAFKQKAAAPKAEPRPDSTLANQSSSAI